MQQVWISALGLSMASLLGSLAGFLIRRLPHRWNDGVMGFSAGLMLSAATIGLILPAMGQSEGWLSLVPVLGVVLGALFLNLLDLLTPHMHVVTGLDQETHRHNAALSRVTLFVMAVALHKLPEGIATGVGFNAPDVGNAWLVTAGIALQNIPEGLIVVVPLLLSGVSRLRTLVISLSIALLEIVGVWIGYGLGAVFIGLLPLMLAIAGGAMLYVVSDEMIPDTHAHGNERLSTYMLLLGFMTLLLMEKLI